MLPPGSAAQGVQIRLQKEAPRALTLLGRSNITQRGGVLRPFTATSSPLELPDPGLSKPD